MNRSGLLALCFALAVAGAAGAALSDCERCVRVEKAIRFLVAGHPASPAYNDAFRSELAAAFLEAGEVEGVDPLLLVAVSFLESSFRTGAAGKAGEVGLFQVHGVAAKGCDLTTVRGQAQCGARWLAECRRVCGGWESALVAYAHGECRAEDGSRAARAARARLGLWKRLDR